MVAAGIADRCTIQISYAIGVANPLSFYVDTHGTGEVDPAVLEKLLPELIGGPDGDAGLTGRKIIVDTYGGAAPHGGGAFSGKDPTKVDRSAAYACRYLAKNVVAAGLADRCTIQIAYAIGVARPVSFHVDLHGTGKVDPALLEKVLPDLINGATPRAIREHLGLNKPIYARTAAYGHFGRQPDNEGGFSWEKTDLAPELKKLA